MSFVAISYPIVGLIEGGVHLRKICLSLVAALSVKACQRNANNGSFTVHNAVRIQISDRLMVLFACADHNKAGLNRNINPVPLQSSGTSWKSFTNFWRRYFHLFKCLPVFFRNYSAALLSHSPWLLFKKSSKISPDLVFQACFDSKNWGGRQTE